MTYRFSPATDAWFTSAFAKPTPAQAQAWEAISAAEHTLVVAPTGSGKTLAAFLYALDQLTTTPPPEDVLRRCRVVYVSPLKALAVDVERNLRSPLTGIRQAAGRLGIGLTDVEVAVRSGDTPTSHRRTFARRPSDILITTPESLFLILTSTARDALRGVHTVIVDEVHAVCGTKRGAHLSLSLERLDALLDHPAQRIGLSATVRPTQEVADFLAGGRAVTVVQPPARKYLDLTVAAPMPDMSTLGEPTGDISGSAFASQRRTSVWPAVEERVLDLIEAHRSTIVFANSRRLAERLTSRLNELAWQRRQPAHPEPEPVETTATPFPRPPAEVMAQAGSGSATPLVARAHHGSMSRQERTDIEEELKTGRLPAVVATSSLELGIDMGAVDLVIQVESPPSVASGVQRIGRAGHQVGAVSKGVIFPKYRGDLVTCTVTAERMQAGEIEALRYPRNPLDVLAQQIVAMVAMDPWDSEDLTGLVRRAAPFATLPASALESVLDMLSGRYPSDAFAELRPRVNWDRLSGALTARPGAGRLAVTSGGTIPDRGLFGVFVVGDAAQPGRRVGELDEEMVYESRVGDVFLLGSSSWRIEDITHDRVLVSPAPGEVGKMPFWKGDAPGRPVELGRALGAFIRDLSTMDDSDRRERARSAGLDDWGIDNLLSYVEEQREAVGYVPDDRTVVVERFRDELGDWRVCVHSPFGAQLNGPWALAIAARLRERYGLDGRPMHTDDGIVIRLPEMETEAPPADLALFDPEEIEPLVTSEVGGSALFAARFRECASRALLLPKRDPKRRAALWQQRQRAAQLLQVTRDYGSFPILLETMRECLQDVFDVPSLVGLMRDLRSRRIRLVEVESGQPSPFARSLLFSYVGMFLYEGDAPLAEQRAHALTLDSKVLAELLGQVEIRDLLDADALAEVEHELQWLAPGRQAFDLDSTADLLRVVGDLTTVEAEQRGATAEWLNELARARRAVQVRIAGEDRWIIAEDASRVRDALGVALPPGIPSAFVEPVTDPLGDLISRFARTHGPFHPDEAGYRLGIGTAVVSHELHRLAAQGRVVPGEFRPGSHGQEWCDATVLRSVRRRSLAKLRRDVEPADPRALARFLPAWHQIDTARSRGRAALERAIEQLAGAVVPASALETLVLPARVGDYTPALLDELTTAGEVVWCGSGALPGHDGWISVAPVDLAPLVLPEADDEFALTPLHTAVLSALDGDQALFFRSLSDRVYGDGSLGHPDDTRLNQALWDLVWSGLVTNDTLAPLRARLESPGTTTHRRRPTARSRIRRYGRPVMPVRSGVPTVAGRWSRVPSRSHDDTRKAHALAETLLDRHGILTRGAVAAERLPGGFAGIYPVLRAFEDSGHCRRGYFVDSLGAAQFAFPGAVDRLRAVANETRHQPSALALAATDPANPYGAALPWPSRAEELSQREPTPIPSANGEGSQSIGERGHRPGRKAGAMVVLVDGDLVLYVERGGRTVLSWTDDVNRLTSASVALAAAVREGGLGRLAVEKADGVSVHNSALAEALLAAGFSPTPRGLRLRS